MSNIVLKNVCKSYDKEHYAVQDFSLEIPDREFVIFVGPSGCGKSTTLRMIAGLEEITSGELWIDGQLCNYVEAKDRDLSMVFQNYALYPNMTVYENMAFSMKIRKQPKDEVDKKVHEAAKMLGIEHLLDRRPAALSGGQKQRVAIGSAIMRRPKAFLMDEPLSNLDAKLRAQMRVELAKLHKELKTTVIYVTHDQTEAMTLGTKNYCYERRCCAAGGYTGADLPPSDKQICGWFYRSSEYEFYGNDGDGKKRSGLSGGRRRSYPSCQRRERNGASSRLSRKNGDFRSETGGFTGRNNRFRTSDLLRRESVEGIC